jgi:hypothetical protein
MRALFPHSLASHKRKADHVYVLFCAFKTFKMIDRPADCEIRSVIHFLNARNMKPDDILRQICEVSSENTMSDGMVRERVRKFNEGRDNEHEAPRSGRLSVVTYVFTGSHDLQGGDVETDAALLQMPL